MNRKSILIVAFLLLLSLVLGACQPVQAPAGGGEAAAPAKLILATTTSTQDSGLLDVILPDFEQQANADLDVVAVGTGQALQLGTDCNADVVLVHCPIHPSHRGCGDAPVSARRADRGSRG